MQQPPDHEPIADLRAQLAALKAAHAELEADIALAEARPLPDTLTVRRLKKRKLQVKERMTAVEDLLTPDIIA